MRGGTQMKSVEIFTDGSCKGNPGEGGWAAILKHAEYVKEVSGNEKYTTNNRMELTAVINGLQMLNQPCNVTLYSDSKYVIDGINKYMSNWRKNGWRTANNKKVSNIDLWQELLVLTKIHHINFVWIKGHSENINNNRCNMLAKAAYNQ